MTIKRSLKDKETVGVLSFDIEKAFDRVWRKGLIYKMIKLSFPGHIIRIINSFLTNRQFYVKLENGHSPIMKSDWGVPQGSALSPTLYNFYIHDIPNPTTHMCMLTLYADDTILLTRHRNINIISNRLSLSAETIYNYYNKWKISINTTKTRLTCFTNRKTKQLPIKEIRINGIITPWTCDMKYLGITFDKKLTMTTHITNLINKVNAAIRMIYPYINRKSQFKAKTKIFLYKTYIRPLLTYGHPILNQLCKTTRDKLITK